MAKNLKINVKNTQLAAALNLSKMKKPAAKTKPAEAEEKAAGSSPQLSSDPCLSQQAEIKKVDSPVEKKETPPSIQEPVQKSPEKLHQETQKETQPEIRTPYPPEAKPDSNRPTTHYSSRQQERPHYSKPPYSRPPYPNSGGGSSSYRGQQRPPGERPPGAQGSSGGSYYGNDQRAPYRPSFQRPPQRPYADGRTSSPHTPRPPGSGYQGGGYQGGNYQGGANQRPGGFRPHGSGPGSGPGSGSRPHAGPRTPYAPRRDDSRREPFRPGQPGGYRPPDTRRPALPPKEMPRFEEGKDKKTPKTFEHKAPPKEFKEHKPAKKMQERSFDARDRKGLGADIEEQGWRKRRPSHKLRAMQTQEEIIRPKNLKIRVPITIKDLAAAMKLKASQLIAKLFMKGVILTLNDFLEDETTIQLLGHDFDCEISIDRSEEDRVRVTDKTIRQEIQEAPKEQLILRPPVVAFMGHVDHGKTSLIDAIRKSDVASGEAGAITQHIGAFKCHTAVGDLTILDTPGHEAFSAMRSRGADVTDIVVLVIAGDEGIRAQTLEAMQQAQTAHVPIVVALNKCDKPNFNAENVYRQLAENQLLPEAWGGQTITVNCSAVTGAGIKELLEMLALQAEILELHANPSTRARGSVIESQMHKGLGAVATILVQNGTLRLGDALVFTKQFAKVKTMSDEHGKMLTEAGPSTPVKITGLSDLPEAGSEFIVVKNEKEAMEIAEKRSQEREVSQSLGKRSAELFLAEKAGAIKKKQLNLILRADVQGSLEALKNSLLKITSNKAELIIISSSVGEISESDVELASASKATIIGFHTQIESHAESFIKALKVNVRLHDIIYHAVDDVRALMKGMLDKLAQETDVGTAEVKAIFKASQLGIIAGCIVTDGSIKRSSHVRQVRENQTIWKGAIQSLKKVKEDVREVSKGQECGIVLNNHSDIKVGDILQAYEITYLEQEL